MAVDLVAVSSGDQLSCSCATDVVLREAAVPSGTPPGVSATRSGAAGHKQLSELVAGELQVVASSSHSFRSLVVLERLLRLPAVQKLLAESVSRLLFLGMELKLQLPVVQLLHQQLAAAHHLSCDDVRPLLFAAFEEQVGRQNCVTHRYFEMPVGR